MRLIDADGIIKDRVENDPVVIAVMCEQTSVDFVKILEKIVEKQIDIQDKLYRCFDKELQASLRGELRGIAECLSIVNKELYGRYHMNLTFDEAIENHRKMWNWIADETERRNIKVCKIDYFLENNLVKRHNLCYCCEYGVDSGRKCYICPINWGIRKCFDSGAAYSEWVDCETDDWKSAAKYAREIANLPAREEVRR